MPTRVTIRRTARRKDGNAIGTVRNNTAVSVSSQNIKVSSSRSIPIPRKENVRVSKKG